MRWSFEELRDVPWRDRALTIMCLEDPRHPTTVTVVDTENKIHLPKIGVPDARRGERWVPCNCRAEGHLLVGRLVVQALRDRDMARRRGWRIEVGRVSRSRSQT